MLRKTDAPVVKAVEAFLSSPHRNQWLEIKTKRCFLKVYVRKGRHLIDNQMRKCFDIASITAVPQGTGTFTEFLSFVEQRAREKEWAVFVESMLNERLMKFFERRGYVWLQTGIIGWGGSMYRLPYRLP